MKVYVANLFYGEPLQEVVLLWQHKSCCDEFVLRFKEKTGRVMHSRAKDWFNECFKVEK